MSQGCSLSARHWLLNTKLHLCSSSTALHPAKQHLDHCLLPTNKKQQKHNKTNQLLSVGSLCLKFACKHTEACSEMLWCLGKPVSLLYSLPGAVFLSSASLSWGSCFYVWEGLGHKCLDFVRSTVWGVSAPLYPLPLTPSHLTQWRLCSRYHIIAGTLYIYIRWGMHASNNFDLDRNCFY